MNLQSLWVGHEYAYDPHSRNSRAGFRPDLRKVTLLSTRKHREWRNEKATTYCKVEADGRQFEVTSRQIVDFWDTYADERDERNRIALERAAREREERERTMKRRELLREKLATVIGCDSKTLIVSSSGIIVPMTYLTQKFGIDDEVSN